MKADKRKGKVKKFDLGGPTSYEESGSAGGTNSFKDAFKAARKAGQGTFTWQGKKYTTEMAGEKKAAPADKPAVPAAPKVEAPSVSGPRSGGRGSKPGMARVGSGRYDDPTSSFGERVMSPLSKLGDIFGRRAEERVMKDMNVDRAEARKRLDAKEAASGMNRGGGVKKFRGGGSVGSASKRADGIASRGKTRCKIV